MLIGERAAIRSQSTLLEVLALVALPDVRVPVASLLPPEDTDDTDR